MLGLAGGAASTHVGQVESLAYSSRVGRRSVLGAARFVGDGIRSTLRRFLADLRLLMRPGCVGKNGVAMAPPAGNVTAGGRAGVGTTRRLRRLRRVSRVPAWLKGMAAWLCRGGPRSGPRRKELCKNDIENAFSHRMLSNFVDRAKIDSTERQTPERAAVLAAIAPTGCPPLLQEALDLPGSEAATLSTATVYRALKELACESGVCLVAHAGEPMRYESAGREDHLHFQCREGRRVYEVTERFGGLGELVLPRFALKKDEVILYGSARYTVATQGLVKG